MQRAKDLPQSAVFDTRTWDRIKALTATPLAFSATSTGNGVRDLQIRLKLLGYWPYSITGTMEPALASRALTVQRAKDLPQSAAFDTRTWDRIKALTATPTQISSTASGGDRQGAAAAPACEVTVALLHHGRLRRARWRSGC